MADPLRASRPTEPAAGQDAVGVGHVAGRWTPDTSDRSVAGPRRTVLLVAIVVAVGLQLWGIYRPTPPPAEPGLPHLDKVFHAASFAAPVLLLCLLIGRIHLLVVTVFAAHAVLSELIQAAFYTRRSGDLLDSLADLTGIAIAVGAYAVLAHRRSARADPLARSGGRGG